MSENQPYEPDELYEHHRIIADPNQSLLRIDKFLMDKLPNATRNKVQAGIKEGHVLVNGQKIGRASCRERGSSPG